ncbi:MAG: DUF177 domain-containing protein [SAR202 cluster bacterium]|nr:DUF177 domain-containing protein [SAR202 cluster bacterium]
MRFNVAGLLRATVGATRQYEIEPELVRDDGEVFEEVQGAVRMMRTDRGVLVEAQLRAIGSDSCSRCLAPIRTRLEASVEEEFYPINPFPGVGLDLEERDEDRGLDDTVFLIDDRNEIDLREVARQALIATRPMAPVCRPECAGLCPVCHSDRNVSACACESSMSRPASLHRLAEQWRLKR